MSVWSNRDYVRVWSGQVISVVGDGVHKIAILLWTKQTTGSNAAVAAVAIASAVPTLIASPIGGGLADRFDRRRLMIAADVVRVLTSLSIAILLLSGELNVPLLCAATAVASLAAATFDPAYAASVTMLVPAEQRASANAMNLANSAAAGLLGPAIGGVLIAATGFGTALVIDAASFAVSAVLIATSRIRTPSREHGADGGLQLCAAVQTVWRQPSLRSLTGLGMTLNLATAPLGVLLVALTVDQLGGGARTLGALQAVMALGLLGGSFVAAVLARARRALLVSLLGVGASVALIGASSAVLLAGAAMIGLGIGVAVANTTLMTTFQRVVPPQQQGRVFGLIGAVSQGLRPVGLVMAAPLVTVFGVRGSYAVCGAILLIGTLAWGRSAGLWSGTFTAAGASADDSATSDEAAEPTQRPLVAHPQHH